MGKKHVILFAGIFLFCICAFLNSAIHPSVKNLKRIKIISTIFPLMEFAQAVAGDRGDVEILLPPGAEIHTWQPRPSDVIKIFGADLFVCVGADLEPWVPGLLRSAGNTKLRVFKASEGLPVFEESPHDHQEKHEHADEHDHGALDPHIWLDFHLDQIIIDRLVQVLSEIKPDDAGFFEASGKAYKENLHLLDQKFYRQLSGCRQKTFIVGGHSAYGYLARRYGLHQISLYGLSPDSQPTPREMVEVVQMAKKLDIRVIFFEENVSDDLARVIAKEIGARTLVLNPAANLTRTQYRGRMTFLEIMETNLKNLREGLSCE